MADKQLTAVPTSPKKCVHRTFDGIFSPPKGKFKFEIFVDKGCSPQNEPIWKLVFDLYMKDGADFKQVVHISYEAKTENEQQGVKDIAVNGITDKAFDAADTKVLPLAQKINDPNPPPDLSKQLKSGMQDVINIQLRGDD